MNPVGPILLVESDRHFASALAAELICDGYRIVFAHDCEQALECTVLERPRLILLGLLAGSQPQTLLQRLLGGAGAADGRPAAPAVLVLGAQSGGLEALRALEAGADDFMARPFSYLELRARMRAILRRTSTVAEPDVLQVGGLRIDLQAHRVSTGERTLELTRIEFELLAELARAPSRVFTREELLRSIWGFRSPGASRTVDTHASRLRAKLDGVTEPHSESPSRHWIVAIRGVGYRLN